MDMLEIQLDDQVTAQDPKNLNTFYFSGTSRSGVGLALGPGRLLIVSLVKVNTQSVTRGLIHTSQLTKNKRIHVGVLRNRRN